ncbi:hypothetical protein [Pseudomonas indica]|uniref:hypothetical protein n=1 Tax=Pseudomonas indica TaxID=137658 RepID=UPI001113D541|nr:hypothetical protein [Pseudomonas indica]
MDKIFIDSFRVYIVISNGESESKSDQKMTLEFIEGQIEFDDFSLLARLVDFRSDLYSLKEDMLQISYEGNFLLDVGWYPSFDPDGCFQIHVVKESDWENPLYCDQANSITEAIHRIRDAQNFILAKDISKK